MTGEVTIEKYADGWRSTGRLARSPAAWLPLAVLAALKVLLLAGLYYFRDPRLSGFMPPAIEGLFGERAVHFPGHVLLLGHMYRWVDLVVTIVPGFLLVAWLMVRVIDASREGKISGRECLARAGRLAPRIFIIWTVFVLAWKGIPMLAGAAGALVPHARVQGLVVLAGFAASLAGRGVFLYGPLHATYSRRGSAAAAAWSVRTAREWSWLTGMIVLTAWAFQAPFEYLVSISGAVLEVAGPDAVFQVLAGHALLEAFALLYLFAATAALMAGSAEQGRE